MSEMVVPGAGMIEDESPCSVMSVAEPNPIAYVMSVNHVTDMVGELLYRSGERITLRRPAMVEYDIEGYRLSGNVLPYGSVLLEEKDVEVTIPMYSVVYVLTFEDDEKHPVVRKYHDYLNGVATKDEV